MLPSLSSSLRLVLLSICLSFNGGHAWVLPVHSPGLALPCLDVSSSTAFFLAATHEPQPVLLPQGHQDPETFSRDLTVDTAMVGGEEQELLGEVV